MNEPGTRRNSATTMTELRSLAESLARGAGDLALAGRHAASSGGDLGGGTKSTKTDMVTEFDRSAEALIVSALRQLRPDDAIVGEEGTADDGTSGYAWYIDPIDGTTNFVYDQPAWSTSVGVALNGEMVAGAVFIAPLGEMFSAALGEGATLNGHPISVSTEADLALALVGTGFNYRADVRRAQAQRLARMIPEVRDMRRSGSAAIDLCFVAAGRLDIYFEQYLNSWDAAAGELIAREAGAVTSDFTGGRCRPEELVASTPGVHRELLALLDRSR